MSKNAYFQIEVENKQVFLKIVKAVDGGANLATNEVANYLASKNLPFDLASLDAFIKGGKGRLKLCDGEPILESEGIVINVSEDKMSAYCRFYAPFTGGAVKNEEDIISDLKLRGVKFGIVEETVKHFLATREYCKTYVIAKGRPVEEGSDAFINYLFETNLSAKPAMNEDGSVDYHNLNTVCHVMAGDELAKMTPAVVGTPGMNVFGETIKPRDVKNVKFQFGNNIEISEDGLTLISKVNGHVNLVEDKVFVSSVYDINNVDASTGDVEFNGDILIRGDVKTGYRVKSTGSIEIKGAVENAYVEAGGNIVVARGINGMANGTLKAEGNILCKYIQNAKVYAGGYIESDCSINSEVVASEYVRIQGKKGFITGGIVRAGKEIEVKSLGSDMGADASVEVGTDPAVRDRYARLQKEVAEFTKSVAQNEPVAVALIQRIKSGQRVSPEQLKMAQDIAKQVSEQKEAIKRDTQELAVLEIEMDKESDAVVRVTGVAYPGSTVTISGAMLYLKTEYHYCRFKKENSEVRMVAM